MIPRKVHLLFFVPMISFCSGLLIVAGCNINSTEAAADSTDTVLSKTMPTDSTYAVVPPACYAYQTSNNIVLLTLTSVRPAVSGHLTYDFMGKDKNEGTIDGKMAGDTLYADYRFISGGKHSVRHVAFLKKGDAFVEGSGDTLSFNGAILKQVPCPDQ